MTFETLYVDPRGRTSRADFIGAMLTLLAVETFYFLVVKAGLNGEWVQVTLFFPAAVLLSRRLHDLGRSAAWLLIPGAVDAAAIGLHWMDRKAPLQPAPVLAAVIVSAGFVIWGLIGEGRDAGRRAGGGAA